MRRTGHGAARVWLLVALLLLPQSLEDAARHGGRLAAAKQKAKKKRTAPASDASATTAGSNLAGRSCPERTRDFNRLINKAEELRGEGNHRDALACMEGAVQLQPQHAAAAYHHARALESVQAFKEAFQQYHHAIALAQARDRGGADNARELVDINEDLGRMLRGLGVDHVEKCVEHLGAAAEGAAALGDAYRAIVLYNDQGSVLLEHRRYLEAESAFLRATELGDQSVSFNNLGNARQRLGDFAGAVAAYRDAVRVAEGPQAAGNAARFHYNAARALESVPGAAEDAPLADYRRAVELKADFHQAYARIAKLTLKTDAVASLAAARAAVVHLPREAWYVYAVGEAQAELARFDDSLASYRAALDLTDNALTRAEIFWSALHMEQFLCSWANSSLSRRQMPGILSAELAKLPAGDTPAIRPLQALLYLPMEQLAAATGRYAAWVDNTVAPLRAAFEQAAARPAKKPKDGVLRVGYVSADFSEHPVGMLLQSVPQLHDRARFKVVCYSLAPAPANSAVRRRYEATADAFVDVAGQSAVQIATRVRKDGIHILVDLMGYTKRSLAEIFALRPAPLQVAYMGWPASTFAPYIDYVVADAIIATPSLLGGFSEKVLYMPHSYYVGDYAAAPAEPAAETLAAAARNAVRAEEGLPVVGSGAVVFCSFNQHYKLDPETLVVWAAILRRVPGSVLWLLDWGGYAVPHLRREFQAQGVHPRRIIFSKLQPAQEHLRRAGAADLFLDTFSYNGHTSAMDALWAGVPVLTLPGEKMPSRVAGSLLAALGDCEDLVVGSLREYEERAVAMAAEHQRTGEAGGGRLAQLQQRLRDRDALRGNALFNTTQWVRDLEARLRLAWELHAHGLPPRHVMAGPNEDACATEAPPPPPPP